MPENTNNTMNSTLPNNLPNNGQMNAINNCVQPFNCCVNNQTVWDISSPNRQNIQCYYTLENIPKIK